IPDPNALNRSGPCMCAPTLLGIGWLDENAHAVSVDLSGSGALSSSAGQIVELSVLAGAPGPGWTRPPVTIRFGDLLFEYRFGVVLFECGVGGAGGWEGGVPDAGAGWRGWLVAHRTPLDAPFALYVGSIPARPGEVFLLGKDTPLDIFHKGPLKLSVLSFDAA